MNTTKHTEVNRRRTLVATAVAFTLMVACTAVPTRLAGATAVRPELQRQLDLQKPTEPGLQKPTDPGLVLTLGDVLFTSGRAELQPVAMGNLHQLVNFLDKYPDRRVAIHGYTDSLGSEEYNQGLSERRANSVKAYLADHGIDSTRLSASGMGQSAPVAGNDSGAGRQQNRRVEVIISNPPTAVTQRTRTARMIFMLALFQSVTGSVARPLL